MPTAPEDPIEEEEEVNVPVEEEGDGHPVKPT